MGSTYIGIDLGTTFLKGAVIDLERMRLGSPIRAPFPPFISGLPASHREVDPGAITDAVTDLAQRLMAEAADCSGIVMCTQMHGLVLTDAQGAPLSNAITWQDERTLDTMATTSESYFNRMSRLVSDRERLELGNDLLPGRPLGVLYWLKEQTAQYPAVREKQTIYPCSLADYVVSRLCHTRPSTEPTNAAAHGAYNLERQDWHHEMINRLGLDCYSWPCILPFQAVAGHVELNGAHIPCHAPVGDHQCAVLGTLLADDELSINASTGSQVAMLTSRYDASLAYQTRPYFDGRYLKAVIHIPAGRALNALMRLLNEMAESQGVHLSDPWSYVEQVSQARQGTDLRVNLAFFPSSCGDRGSIENVREDNLTVGDVFAAACVNMAENYVDCADRIAPERPWRQLVFSGGLMQKMSALRLSTIQRFGVDYRFAPSREDTLMGLMVLAMVCSGKCNSTEEASRIVAETVQYQSAASFNNT